MTAPLALNDRNGAFLFVGGFKICLGTNLLANAATGALIRVRNQFSQNKKPPCLEFSILIYTAFSRQVYKDSQ
jgi:hypothetical protein